MLPQPSPGQVAGTAGKAFTSALGRTSSRYAPGPAATLTRQRPRSSAPGARPGRASVTEREASGPGVAAVLYCGGGGADVSVCGPSIWLVWYSNGPRLAWNCHPNSEPQNCWPLVVSSAGISMCTISPGNAASLVCRSRRCRRHCGGSPGQVKLIGSWPATRPRNIFAHLIGYAQQFRAHPATHPDAGVGCAPPRRPPGTSKVRPGRHRGSAGG